MDRIDLHIEVTPVSYEELRNDVPRETSSDIRERVVKARKIQSARFKNVQTIEREHQTHCNAEMNSKQVREFCRLNETSAQILRSAMDKLGFSARAYDRILKVARTIADLDGAENIEASHIGEAVQYRSLDRKE